MERRAQSRMLSNQEPQNSVGADRSRRPRGQTFMWRCRKCNLCLAEMGPEMVDVAYKDLHWVFHGRGMFAVRCRRCKELNALTIGEAGEWAATA